VQWTITLAILAFYPVLYTISIGQLSLLLAVSAFELLRAIEAGRTRAAAGWLAVLSVKPQLLPAFVLLLAVRGYWPVLRAAAAIAVVLGLTSAIVLGKMIWFNYLASLHELEQFFAAGTPAYMMNLRGALTRVVPAISGDGVDVLSVAAWVVALAALGIVLVRRPAASQPAFASDFALTLAVALFFNPHLFPQDTVIWIVMLVVFVQASREQDGRWVSFASFALCWPILFAVARTMDAASGSVHHLTPAYVLTFAAVVVAFHTKAMQRVTSLGAVGQSFRSATIGSTRVARRAGI
jgi:hypothetical protein